MLFRSLEKYGHRCSRVGRACGPSCFPETLGRLHPCAVYEQLEGYRDGPLRSIVRGSGNRLSLAHWAIQETSVCPSCWQQVG